ncbi:hypothetical protein [Phytohabitans houttuyneae]|uniref:hypothetical protein n=1 Tax=Phytohabitans houttuyneae TaxID=1076126 RepID=UPI001565B105|nr:hypothetical protein [Phytohabitans houttuyneae]
MSRLGVPSGLHVAAAAMVSSNSPVLAQTSSAQERNKGCTAGFTPVPLPTSAAKPSAGTPAKCAAVIV